MRDELLANLTRYLDEAEKYWWPTTVGYSGDSRTRQVPYCAGPSGTGDCRLRWALNPDDWPRDTWPELVREHEFTHATYDEWWHLADINAKRQILGRLGDSIDEELLVWLLHPYGLSRADFGEGE